MMLQVAVENRGSFALDVRFDAPTPGVVALFGPSGCGKTRPSTSSPACSRPIGAAWRSTMTVLLDTRARHRRAAAERRGIGYVFQDARLFPHLNVAANLNFATDGARPAATLCELRAGCGLLDLEPLMHAACISCPAASGNGSPSAAPC